MIRGSQKVLLVGAGNMAAEYAKVLKAMRMSFLVVGNSPSGAHSFKDKTGIDALSGGINHWLKKNKPPTHAIVAVNEGKLGAITRSLLTAGVRSILVEKPADLTKKGISKTERLAKAKRASIFVAYNRRFYTSVQETLKLIKKDGGVLSFTFDFTEWAHRVRASKQPRAVKKKWLVVNSSHVIDLAFFLGGRPKKISASTSGSLDWHPSAAVYGGSGITDTGALFSYHADWLSAGRWGIEIMTKNHRIILRPLEQLAVIKKNSIVIEEWPINDTIDKKFKPGLYRQVQAFLSRNTRHLASITDQRDRFGLYGTINNE